VRKLQDVVLREIAGEVFLVPIRGRLADLQELFVVNDVGEWIWERLDGSRSLDELAEGVSTTFEVSREQALLDIEGFMSELSGAGLLEPDTAAETT
jgi:hypothetical protein